MNILQGIEAPVTFCVSLNQTALIDPAQILARFSTPTRNTAWRRWPPRPGWANCTGASTAITAAPTGPTAFMRTAWSAHCVAAHFGERL
jgi:hypothetical protein